MKNEKIQNKEELAKIIDDIIKKDDESAHICEDILHLQLIMQFCPDWVKEEVERLSKANFYRWYS